MSSDTPRPMDLAKEERRLRTPGCGRFNDVPTFDTIECFRPRMKVRVHALAMALVCSVSPAAATPVLDQLVEGASPAEILQLERLEGQARTDPTGALIRLHRNFRAEDGFVTLEQLDTEAKVARASQRAAAIGQFLRFDFNGDLTIDESDLREISKLGQFGLHGSRELAESYDRDRDGRVPLDEALAAIDSILSQQRSGGQIIRRFDLDRNGSVTRDEAASGIAALAGIPLEQLPDGARGKPAGAQHSGSRVQDTFCAMPEPTREQQTILVSTRQGGAVPTVSIVGQDAATDLAQLEIDPGDTKLVIVALSKRPMIWQLTGAVERVAGLVVQPARPRSPFGRADAQAGVVGLQPEQVHFLPAANCIDPFSATGGRSRISVDRAATLMGRPFDVVIGTRILERISLPTPQPDVEEQPSGGTTIIMGDREIIIGRDGSIAERNRLGPSHAGKPHGVRALLSDLAREYPAGRIYLHPADVQATGAVEPYENLPGAAGMLALIESGHIAPTEEEETFVVPKPLHRLPAEMPGWIETLILEPGVPVPIGGDRVSAGIYRGGTGECLAGSCAPQ